MTDDATPNREEYQNPIEKLDGMTEVRVKCLVPEQAPDACDGWETTVELDEPATFDEESERIFLPGFSWECPECGNPYEFKVEGIWVSKLV